MGDQTAAANNALQLEILGLLHPLRNTYPPAAKLSVMTSLPTITLRESYRRSDDPVISCIYRRSDDPVIYFFTDDPTIMIWVFWLSLTDDPTIQIRIFCRKLPTIRRSLFGFFAESYRRSDDHISVFFPKVTDDPTIKFRFFSRKLPTIRRSQFGFFSESYLRSDDQIWFFCRKLPTIRRSVLGFFPAIT